MRGCVTVNDADNIELTIKFTAKLGEWRELMRQLGERWPSWQFGGLIADAISKGAAHIDVTDEELSL